jgi:hypothetical protein
MFKAFFGSVMSWFRNLFWKQEMELTLVGLQNSGKTTLVNVISVDLRDLGFSFLSHRSLALYKQ